MKKLVLIAFLCAFGGDTKAQYEPAAKEVLERVSAKYSKIPAFRADFSYKLKNSEASIDEEMDGLIHIMEDKFRLELLSKIIFFDGELIREYDSDFQEYTIRTYDSEEEAEINLSTVLNLYKEGFKYRIRGQDAEGYEVELVPEDRSKSFFKILMDVRKDYSINSFTYFEKNGNLVTTDIKKFQALPNLKPNYFDFFQAKLVVVDSVDMR